MLDDDSHGHFVVRQQVFVLVAVHGQGLEEVIGITASNHSVPLTIDFLSLKLRAGLHTRLVGDVVAHHGVVGCTIGKAVPVDRGQVLLDSAGSQSLCCTEGICASELDALAYAACGEL